jgi:hypothetical protein
MSHGGILTDLGEMGNWETLVDNRRQELVLWMRNYLAELTGQQLIESYGGGVQFEGSVLAAGERGSHWRKRYRGFYRGSVLGDEHAT